MQILNDVVLKFESGKEISLTQAEYEELKLFLNIQQIIVTPYTPAETPVYPYGYPIITCDTLDHKQALAKEGVLV